MQENWRDVIDYEGVYSVSSHGRIRRDKGGKGCRSGKILTPKNHSAGYHFVALSKDNKRKQHLIHRLVAKTFLPNSTNLPQVNHKNGIKTDNRVSNLEWCTPAMNEVHKRAVLQKSRKLSDEQIIQLRELYATGILKQSALSIQFGIDQVQVSNIVTGKSWPEVGGPISSANFEGSLIRRSKLSIQDIRTMRQRHEQGATYAALSKDYDIALNTAFRICARHLWSFID